MGYASIRRFSSLKCCGFQISSASRNAIFSPFASDTPRLRAAETPAFAWVIILIRADANLRTTSGPLSVEPSSTTITSKSSNVCAWTLSRVDSICFPLLNKGMITENRGEPDIWLAGRGQLTYRAARARTPLWQGFLKNFLNAFLLTLEQFEFFR